MIENFAKLIIISYKYELEDFYNLFITIFHETKFMENIMVKLINVLEISQRYLTLCKSKFTLSHLIIYNY